MSSNQDLFQVTQNTESLEKRRGQSKRKLSKNKKAELVSPAEIQLVFEEWLKHCKKRDGESRRGPQPRLSPERARDIGAALHDYGLETCIDAVLGCSQSSWHMGDNPQGKQYNDIELIFRNEQKIESFAEAGYAYRTKGGFLD
jgi:hypothetical protein